MSTPQANYWSDSVRSTGAELRASLRATGLSRNIAAGLSTALVALPLNIALALACNLPASVGLWTGAVAGLLGAFLGGTKLQITGPEVALAPLTLEIVLAHGFEGLVWCAVIAGVLQIGLGLLRIGRVVNAVPAPVIAGFMAAVGLMVLDGQLPRLLGLPDGVRSLAGAVSEGAFGGVSMTAVAIGIFATACVVVLPRIHPRIPAPLAAVGLPIIAVTVFALQLPHVPDVDATLPPFGIPGLEVSRIVALLPSAVALALLASLDSLLSAVSMDARTGQRHRSDQELVAQGIANVVCGVLGAMPVAGAIVRSAAAHDAGADNRAAPIAQSLALGALLALLGGYLDRIPLAALAAILCVVGVKLIQPVRLRALYRHAPVDFAIAAVTVVGILAWDFVLGVAAGVVAALVRLGVSRAHLAIREERDVREVSVLYRLDGPVVFANVARIAGRLATETASTVTLDLEAVPELDVTATEILGQAIARLTRRGAVVHVRAAIPAIADKLRSVAPTVRHVTEHRAEPLSRLTIADPSLAGS